MRYDAVVNDFDRDGFGVAEIALSSEQCDHFATSLPLVVGAAGIRNLIFHPTVHALLRHESLGEYLWCAMGRDLVAVKATLFDKTIESNWRVQWHQDRSIAVKERREVAGYTCWGTKAGAIHVEPPADVLSQMVAVRVHLDDCWSDNGPLRVMPGTHRLGKLGAEDLANMVIAAHYVEIAVGRGALVLMRPLLVHSSAPSVYSSSPAAATHRRVLHIEFASREAISPLCWHSTVPMRRRAA